MESLETVDGERLDVTAVSVDVWISYAINKAISQNVVDIISVYKRKKLTMIYMSDDDELQDNCYKHLPIDIQSNWKVLPKGMLQLLFEYTSKEDVNTYASDVNNGFPSVYKFCLSCVDYFKKKKDSEQGRVSASRSVPDHNWMLWQIIRSSYILAAEFYLIGRDLEALYMVFYAALVEEGVARGLDNVMDIMCPGINECQRSYLVLELIVPDFFAKCAYFHRAAENTKSRKDMASFLLARLGEHPATKHYITRIHSIEHGEGDTDILHCFSSGESEPHQLMKISCANGNGKLFEVEVYEDTLLRWVVNIGFAMVVGCGCFPLLASSRCKVLPRSARCPSIRVRGKHFYFLTSHGETLGQLGIINGDSFYLCNASHPATIEEREKPNLAEKGGQGKHTQKKTSNWRKKSKKKSKPSNLPASIYESSIDELREVHSKSMEPVFDELRPRLKVIREKLSSLLLQKTLSKKKRALKSPKTKTAIPGEVSVNNLPTDSQCGKAGKAVYPVLAGEASNLFKTAKSIQQPRNIITLDLHGYSRYKAIGVLRKGIQEWIVEAMRGQYPFVVPVDIICGAGNQVLSEVVAQFIRDNSQVANRPKGCV